MTLQSAHVQYIDQASQPFGGWSVVSELLTDRDLEYLLTFPGFIFVVKPWAPRIDLQEAGYLIGTPYHVLDESLRRVYSDISTDGFWGSTKDVQQLLRAQHGSFLHIQFDTADGPNVGLLWVCNQLSPQQLANQIQLWQQQADRIKRPVTNEVYLSITDILLTDVIQISFLPGVWSTKLTPTTILNHPNRVTSEHQPAETIITLYPQQTGWYLFEVVRGVERLPLVLSDVQGIGCGKIRLTASGAYFFQLQSSDPLGVRPNIQLLAASSTAASGANSYIRLEATLTHAPREVLNGNASAIADGSVWRIMVPEVLEGSASTLARIGVYGVKAIVDGRAEVGRILKDGTVLAPLGLVSERLWLDASATATADSTGVFYFSATLEGFAAIDADLYEMSYFAATGEGAADTSATGQRGQIFSATADGGADYTAAQQSALNFTDLADYTYYATDPLEMLLLTGARASSLDPLEAWAIVGLTTPYTFGYDATAVTLESPNGSAIAIANSFVMQSFSATIDASADADPPSPAVMRAFDATLDGTADYDATSNPYTSVTEVNNYLGLCYEPSLITLDDRIALGNFITTLKNANLWNTIDKISVYAFSPSTLYSSWDPRVNIRRNDYHSSPLGPVVFTPRRGFTTNGLNSGLDDGANLYATRLNLTPTSATVGIYIRTDIPTTGTNYGACSAANAVRFGVTRITARDTSNMARMTCYNAVDGDVMTFPNNNGSGWYSCTRTATEERGYKSGVRKVSRSMSVVSDRPYVDLTTGVFSSPGNYGDWAAGEYAAEVLASAWTDDQHLTFYNALQTLLTYCGAAV